MSLHDIYYQSYQILSIKSVGIGSGLWKRTGWMESTKAVLQHQISSYATPDRDHLTLSIRSRVLSLPKI